MPTHFEPKTREIFNFKNHIPLKYSLLKENAVAPAIHERKKLQIIFLIELQKIRFRSMDLSTIIRGLNMADIIDLAEYILTKMGPLTTTKLQKLIYYSQAWHLVWTETPLFSDKIEAWRNGPVIPTLYHAYKGHFKLHASFFYEKYPNKLPNDLTESEKDVVNRVLDFYGHKDAHWLSQLVHMEEPWKSARAKSYHHEHIADEITHHSIFEYYCSL